MMTEAEFNKLPLAQREALQQRLKDEGLYAGGVDGKWGSGTAAAFKQQDQRRIDDEERQRKAKIDERGAAAEAATREAEADARRADAEAKRAETAAQELKTKGRQDYNEEAGTPLGIGTKIAAGPGAFVAGYGAGRSIGSGINRLADASQRSKNEVLQGAAEDRLRGITTRDGARTGTGRSGAMPSDNPLLRVGGRMLPHAITGGAMMGKGAFLLNDADQDAPFYADMANRGIGTGMLGGGLGIIEQGANYAVNPGVAPDARAISIMESNQLRRNGVQNRGKVIDAEAIPNERAALPPPKAAPNPGTAAYMRRQLAKDYDIKGTSRMTKAELATKLSEVTAEHGAKRTRTPKGGGRASALWPAMAAGIAYAATPDDAEASTGESATGQDRALTNAAGAGGAYLGVNRLMKMAPQIGRAVAAGGEGLSPMAIDAMTDYSPDELNMARNTAARHLPEALQFGAVDEAREMAQVPERGRMADPNFEDPEDFDAQIAELAQILNELDAPEAPRQPVRFPPQMPLPSHQQNRLLQR
jgi:hypothetical protein